MNRRRFLSSLATTGTAFVAGCGEDADGNSGSGGGTTTTTGNELVRDPAKSEVFAKHYEPHTSAAMDIYEEAVSLLKTEFEKFDTLDTTDIDVKIGAVEAHLDEAAAELSQDYPYWYAFARYVWGFQEFREWLLEVVEVISYAKRANDQWVTGRSKLANDQFERARDPLSESARNGRDLSVRIPDTWEPGPDVAEYREWYDIDAFDQFDAWSASLVEALQPVGEWGDALAVLADGYWQFVKRASGFEAIDKGKSRYEKEEFERAIHQFETAKSRFESVEEYAADHEDQVPDRFQSEYDAFVCLADAMVDAVEAWRQATLARQSGDEEATQEWIDEAERLRKSC